MIHDIAAAIGATSRIVRKRERDGKPAEAVIAERTYDTGIKDLWDALTNPERLPRWFSPVTGDLKLGGRYQVEGNAGGTVTVCDPPKTLELTWEFGGTVSWVEVHLHAVSEDETHLQLVHEGHIDPAWAEKYGPGATGVGWDLGLLGLQTHIASGWSKPPEADMEWTRTDEYKLFVRKSSAGWRDASVAAGNDPQVAASAAANTTSFYLGEAPPEGG
ncbi:SRPBCC family protein [Hyphomonas sp. KY3]|uniref:SRPBCC family protein n=1 Tax=Hyphomonas sp. KY3 TaxID=2016196 RepID=UPI001A8C6B5F|nr:SRPBCC family protein [Hyphomonas sp. KY3]QSR21575.1 polyketide cyclase [Hyphomonas sp. KY3]